MLSLDGGDVRADPADVHDLRAGVVPGAGVVLRPTGSGVDDLGTPREGAAGGHEWFDTGEGTVDPFADPPRAADLPVQRAAGVQVGGRNGVAREAGPEATAEADEPEPAGGPGRDALEAPFPPPQGRTPRADLPTDAGPRAGDPGAPTARLGDAPIDPLTDPLTPEFDPPDPFAAPSPADPQVVPTAEAPTDPPLEQRRPRPFAGRPDPAFVDPAAPPADPRPALPARHGLEGFAAPFAGPPHPGPEQPADARPDALPVRVSLDRPDPAG